MKKVLTTQHMLACSSRAGAGRRQLEAARNAAAFLRSREQKFPRTTSYAGTQSVERLQFTVRESRGAQRAIRRASSPLSAASVVWSRPSSRRAELSLDMVAVLVLITAAIIVGVVILSAMNDGANRKLDDIDCGTQVMAHAIADTATGGKALSTIKCPTRMITLDTTSEEEVKAAVAEQMRACWKSWGRGRLNLLGKNESILCHVCASITTPNVKELTGLPHYLDTHDVSSGGSYTTYLSGKTSGELYKPEDLPKLASAKLSTDKPVAVIFYHVKGLDWVDRLKNNVVGNPGASATGGAVSLGYAASLVGGPVTIGIAGVVGAGAGVATSLFGTERPSTASIVVVRPMDRAALDDLGCAVNPASNV